MKERKCCSVKVKVERVHKKNGRRLVCNLCGKTLDEMDLENNLTIRRRLGYGSAYDGDRVDLRICCSCFDMLVEGCTVTPIDQTKWEL